MTDLTKEQLSTIYRTGRFNIKDEQQPIPELWEFNPRLYRGT
jgi:hypothetical protein